jgi:hypothetical protein
VYAKFGNKLENLHDYSVSVSGEVIGMQFIRSLASIVLNVSTTPEAEFADTHGISVGGEE